MQLLLWGFFVWRLAFADTQHVFLLVCFLERLLKYSVLPMRDVMVVNDIMIFYLLITCITLKTEKTNLELQLWLLRTGHITFHT